MAEEGGFVRETFENVNKIHEALEDMKKRVDRATIRALKATQLEAKRQIKAQLRGRPRWDHRGKSSRTGAAVDLHLSPHHQPYAGSASTLTGTLRRGVGGVRRPKKKGEFFHGGVGPGGGVRNLYKHITNARYPFVDPGMKTAEPRFPPIYEQAWREAIHRK